MTVESRPIRSLSLSSVRSRHVGLNEPDDRIGFDTDAVGSAIWKGCQRYLSHLATTKYLSPARVNAALSGRNYVGQRALRPDLSNGWYTFNCFVTAPFRTIVEPILYRFPTGPRYLSSHSRVSRIMPCMGGM
jgi:hypothetical protein